MPLKLGCVSYLNARPLIHGWTDPVEFDHPAALCRMLAAAELDVALVSSVEILRNPIYTIVDRVAIACDGPVYSVFLAHRDRLEDLEAISLDPASETSVSLLRCILAERGLEPRLLNLPANCAPLRQREGLLLIGDQAIRYRQQYACELEFLDLGAEWKRLTALPFVFALWLIRPELQNSAQIARQLRSLRDENLSHLDDVIAGVTEFSPEFCANYFRQYLRFTFGEREQEGLLRFRSLCEELGILPASATDLRLV